MGREFGEPGVIDLVLEQEPACQQRIVAFVDIPRVRPHLVANTCDGRGIEGADFSSVAGTPRLNRLRTALLERRSDAFEHKPVEFVAGGRTFSLSASQLGVRPDWQAAVKQAAASTDGFAPVRGLNVRSSFAAGISQTRTVPSR